MRHFSSNRFHFTDKVTSDITDQITQYIFQLDKYNNQASNALSSYLAALEENNNNNIKPETFFDGLKKIDDNKMNQLVDLLNSSDMIYVNPIVAANFLYNVVAYKQLIKEQQMEIKKAKNSVQNQINVERASDASQDPELYQILCRAWQYIKPFIMNKKDEMLFGLGFQIAGKIRTDREILTTVFQKYMEFFYVQYNTYLEEKKKENSKFPLQVDTLVLAFSMAPHLGKYNEMVLLGSALEATSTAEELSKQIRNGNMMEFLHETALVTYTFDYSAIFDLLEREENDHIFDTQNMIQYSGPLLYDTYKVTRVRIKPTKETDEFLLSDLYEDNIIEGEWIEFDHEMPEMIQWGNCILWYQLNGGILLSGLSLPIQDHEEMKEAILLHGYAEYDQLTEKEQKELAAQYGEELELETIEFTDDKEREEYEQVKRNRTKDDLEYSFRVESDFKLIHRGHMTYSGRYVRTMSSWRENRIIFEKKVHFDIVIEMQNQK